jgi:hypothetical protein
MTQFDSVEKVSSEGNWFLSEVSLVGKVIMRFACIGSIDLRRLFGSLSLLLCVFLLLPSTSNGQVTPSNFTPGIINIFAGNGTAGGTYADGSTPTNVPIGDPAAMAFDSQGNLFFAAGGGDGTVANVYVVYGGATPVPPIW